MSEWGKVWWMGLLEVLTLWLMVSTVCALAAGIIAAAKSENVLGFFPGLIVGFFLGPLGILIVLFLQPSQARQMKGKRECPHCKEAMKREASVCPHCHRDSEPWKFDQGYWWVRRDDQWLYLDARGRWVKWTSGSP